MSTVSFRDPLCERAREYVSLRLDGELSELEEALLDAHLSRCSGCERFAVQTGFATTELRAAPLELPGEAIVVPRRRYAGARLLRLGAAAAVVAVAVFAGALQSLRPPRTSIAAPAAAATISTGSEVRDLRVYKRSNLESGRGVGPALIHSLRLPGDG